FYRI
uniref:Antho-RIamide-1 n=1 Tax=Anthopleura elegantissima TaxID=6110 RepID=FYRI_ANTEL